MPRPAFSDDLIVNAMLMDDIEWEEYMNHDLADVDRERLVIAVEEILAGRLLQAGAESVEDVERALIHTVWLLEVLMRSGGGHSSLGEAMRQGITPYVGYAAEDVEAERRLLEAFAMFFEAWFIRGWYRGIRVPTAILYSLLPELCGAVGPSARAQVLPVVLRRLRDQSVADDARAALGECLADYCANPS